MGDGRGEQWTMVNLRVYKRRKERKGKKNTIQRPCKATATACDNPESDCYYDEGKGNLQEKTEKLGKKDGVRERDMTLK